MSGLGACSLQHGSLKGSVRERRDSLKMAATKPLFPKRYPRRIVYALRDNQNMNRRLRA